MNTSKFNGLVEEQFEKCRLLLGMKNDEYTPENDDRLVYFKKAAVLEHNTPKAALLGMLMKHIISISDMCIDGTTTFSQARWEEKITDAMNYLLLLKGLTVEESDEQNRS